MDLCKIKIQSIAVSPADTDFEDNSCLFEILGLKYARSYRFLAGEKVPAVNDGKNFTSNQEKSKYLCYVPLDNEDTINIDNSEISIPEKYVYEIPQGVHMEEAVSLMRSAIRVYSDLFFKGKVNEKETILIIDGANMYGYIAVQILIKLGCKIFLSVKNEDEKKFLDDIINSELVYFIDLSKSSLSEFIASFTNGIGVDLIVDFSLRSGKCEKREIIKMMAPSGRWVNHDYSLQLDPPESKLLFIKNCSIHFSFEESYAIYGIEYGKIRAVVLDAIQSLKEEKIKIVIKNKFNSIKSFEDSKDSLQIGSSVIVYDK